MGGSLFVVATPIGHLDDMTVRAVETLRVCDAILCEDTRHSRVLLERYGIDKPLIAHHKFNEQKSLEGILERLRGGQRLALISDAGTPCINDPGWVLVRGCVEAGIAVTGLPGACSPINALVLSGFDAGRFQFVGFLPKKGLGAVLRGVLGFAGTTVALESPGRLIGTLEEIMALDAERPVAVAREMTKAFEECRRGSVREVLASFQKSGVRGEICLVIAGGRLPEEDLPVGELVELLQQCHGMTLKEAVKLSAKLKGVAKNEVYREFFHPAEEE